MDKKEYFELIEELFLKKKELIDWSYVTEQIEDMKFVEEHIDEYEYPFDFEVLASNKNLTIDFVIRYIDYFKRYEISAQLNQHISENMEFILEDPHVSLKNKKIYRGTEYYEFKQKYSCKDEESYGICEYYKKIASEYYGDHEPGEVDCGLICHDIYGNDHDYPLSLISYNNNAYIVHQNLTEYAIDILINNDKVPTYTYLYGVFLNLSLNPYISLQTKLDTRHIISWDFDAIMKKCSYTERKQIEKIYNIDNNHKEIFDKILEDKTKWKLFIEKLKNTTQETKDALKEYNKREELVDLVMSQFDLDHYWFWCDNISDILSIEFIQNHLDYKYWNFDKILSRDDLTFEFCKKLSHIAKESKEREIDFRKMHTASFVTKELILENLDFPWDLRALLTKNYW